VSEAHFAVLLLPIVIVGWKPILYWLFGLKNQSFRNKSGKAQPIRTKFGIRSHVKGWQRSGNFGRDQPILDKMGAGTSLAECKFFCGDPHDLSATLQRPTFTKFGPEMYYCVPSRNLERHFWKIFTLGVICPQNLKLKVGRTGTSLRAGYRSGDALQILFTPRCSPTTYSCGAAGRQSCPIFGFWPIFLIQNP